METERSTTNESIENAVAELIAAPLAFTLGEDLEAAAMAPYELDGLQAFWLCWLKRDLKVARDAGFEPREIEASRAFCNFVATYKQSGPKKAEPHRVAYVRALLGGLQ